jgi:hypothetical protein
MLSEIDLKQFVLLDPIYNIWRLLSIDAPQGGGGGRKHWDPSWTTNGFMGRWLQVPARPVPLQNPSIHGWGWWQAWAPRSRARRTTSKANGLGFPRGLKNTAVLFQEAAGASGSPVGTLPETDLFTDLNSDSTSKAYCKRSHRGSSTVDVDYSTEDYPDYCI